jgi:Fe-S oxidoreductase
VPGKGSEALANLRNTDTVGGYPLAVRYHWAIDLDLPVLQPGEQTEWLLLAGEGAFDMRYQRALRALVKVLKAAGVKVAVLGAAERDCGDVARRLGDEAGFQRLARPISPRWRNTALTTSSRRTRMYSTAWPMNIRPRRPV